MNDLLTELNLPSRTCTALVGAGGKTTLMLALGRCLSTSGHSTLLTTTTKIWPPAGMRTILADDCDEPEQAIRAAFKTQQCAVYARSVLPGGKLLGTTPEEVCRLHTMHIADAILVEADGAAGTSLKAHGKGEPVVPPCTQTVLVIAGADAIGANMTRGVVHRIEEMERITSRRSGDVISAEDVATLMEVAATYAPSSSSIVYILNKVDTAADVVKAQHVERRLRAQDPSATVLFVSQGNPVTALKSTLESPPRYTSI